MEKINLDLVHELIIDVPDFPKPGIVFKDITPVLANSEAFHQLTDALSELVPQGTQKLVAIESRGFILGSAVAHKRNIGMALARKPGKLPRAHFKKEYTLEYGTDELQLHKDDIKPGEKVCIIDDVLATGGTAQAVEDLVQQAGAELLGHAFIMEIDFLKGRNKLKHNVLSLMSV